MDPVGAGRVRRVARADHRHRTAARSAAPRRSRNPRPDRWLRGRDAGGFCFLQGGENKQDGGAKEPEGKSEATSLSRQMSEVGDHPGPIDNSSLTGDSVEELLKGRLPERAPLAAGTTNPAAARR